jgi:hypothetical protein
MVNLETLATLGRQNNGRKQGKQNTTQKIKKTSNMDPTTKKDWGEPSCSQ